MSVNQLTDDDIDAQTDDRETLAERLGLHPDYTPVVLDPVDGYGPLVDAWVTMQYPLNVSDRFGADHGIIECGNWRHAKQHPDGSGVYRSGPSGGQLVAYRTTGQVVIWNNYHGDPWPHTSEAHGAPAAEFEVPFQFIGEVLTLQTELDMHDEDSILARGRPDGETWVDGELWMRGVVSADVLEGDEEGVLLEHANGSQVYVGLDSTAHDYPMFGFVPFDGEHGIKVPTARDALDLLRPDEALATEMRQGEWFFVDAEETHHEAKGTIQKPGVGQRPFGGSPLDSHIPRDWKPRCHDMEFVRRVVEELADRHDLLDESDRPTSHLEYDDFEAMGVYWQDSPQDIFDKIEAGTIDLSFDRARELAGGVFVRGTVRHRENEHRITKLEGWHQPTTHGREVLVLEPDEMNVHVDC